MRKEEAEALAREILSGLESEPFYEFCIVDIRGALVIAYNQGATETSPSRGSRFKEMRMSDPPGMFSGYLSPRAYADLAQRMQRNQTVTNDELQRAGVVLHPRPEPAPLDTPTKVLDRHIASLRQTVKDYGANVAGLKNALANAERNLAEATARLNAFLAEMDKR